MILPDSELQEIFKEYNYIIYDTNCIISYAFRTEITIKRTGEKLIIEETPFTQIAKDLTNYISTHSKKVVALKISFEETAYNRLAGIVNKKFSDHGFVKNIATKTGPSEYQETKYVIQRHILAKVTKTI